MGIRILPAGDQQTLLILIEGITIPDTRVRQEGHRRTGVIIQNATDRIPADDELKDPNPITEKIPFMDPGQNTASRDMENPDLGLAEVLRKGQSKLIENSHPGKGFPEPAGVLPGKPVPPGRDINPEDNQAFVLEPIISVKIQPLPGHEAGWCPAAGYSLQLLLPVKVFPYSPE
jgi:hypothetical protein